MAAVYVAALDDLFSSLDAAVRARRELAAALRHLTDGLGPVAPPNSEPAPLTVPPSASAPSLAARRPKRDYDYFTDLEAQLAQLGAPSAARPT